MLLEQPLSQVTLIDGAVIAVLTVWIVVDAIASRRRMAKLDTGEWSRLTLYRESIVFLWGATFVVVAAWMMQGRSCAELGLGAPQTIGFGLCVAAVVAACMALAFQSAAIRTDASMREQLAREVASAGRGVARVLPRTQAERFTFMLVSLSAGIGEEIIFRGFFLWGLAHWMPIWAAALASTVLFTFAHLYQEGVAALVRVALLGIIFALLTIISGSLWPAIALHFAVDLSSGESAWAARKEIDGGRDGSVTATHS